MAHKFDVKDVAKLDSPMRRERIPPEATLRKMGLQEGMLVADVGCGTGYFAIPAAEMVGEKGRVWALDLSQGMLDELVRKNPPRNLTVRLCGEADLPLEDASADVVLVAFVLHEVTRREEFLREIRRIMRPGAQVAVIDWKKQEEEKGPPKSERLSLDDAKKCLAEAGFVIRRAERLNQSHYAVIADRERSEE